MSDAVVGVNAATGAHGHGDEAHGDDHKGVHVVPVWLLAAVFVALVGLTFLTVTISIINIGKADLAVAMIIATVKALMVALFFMHLLWDRPFNGLVFLISVLFLGLFLSVALMDNGQTEPDIKRRQVDEAAAAAPTK